MSKPSGPRNVRDQALLDRSQERIAECGDHVRGILRFLGEDTDREGLQETPARFVRALKERFAGYDQDL